MTALYQTVARIAVIVVLVILAGGAAAVAVIGTAALFHVLMALGISGAIAIMATVGANIYENEG